MHGLPIQIPALVLRHFVLEDAAPIRQLNAEASTKYWLPSHVYADQAEATDALAYLIASYKEPRNPRLGPYVLAVERSIPAELRGHVGFSPLDAEVEVSYAIAESARGRGYGAEALAHACDWASKTFGLSSFIAITAAENVASRRLLERARFFHEREEIRHFQGVHRAVSCYRWREQPCGTGGA